MKSIYNGREWAVREGRETNEDRCYRPRWSTAELASWRPFTQRLSSFASLAADGWWWMPEPTLEQHYEIRLTVRSLR